jgi:hypothetical protein
MNVSELKPNYYMFGNKGAVWSNQAHIAQGGHSTTLCGTPMLSSNWCRIENVQTIGCPECLEMYKKLSEQKD